MRPSEALRNHRDAVVQTAERIGAHNIRVFGSVLRGEDTDGSDLDLLVDVPRGTTLLDMVRLQNLLEEQLGVPVDVVTPGDIPARFREPVVKGARPI
ncbi:MAG: nucleotidyltransferase family protein [Phycisphaerae bacterium]